MQHPDITADPQPARLGAEPEPEKRPEGMADIKQLREWHREGCNYYNEYAPEAEEAEAFVYSVQWSVTDIEYLKQFDADRMAMAFNHIQKNLLSMFGHRAANKFEINYKPKEVSDAEESDILTQVHKHYWDAPENAAEFAWGRACWQQYMGPFGVFSLTDEVEDLSREPLKYQEHDWRQVRLDRRRRRPDQLDARFFSIQRWDDVDEVCARFSEHEAKIREYATSGRDVLDESSKPIVDHGGDPYSDENMTPIAYVTKRREVLLIETWYRVKKRGQFIKTAAGWESFDANSEDHQYQHMTGAEVRPGTLNCVYFATWVGDTILEEGKSPDDHPYFPYVIIWGLIDHRRIPHGAVRALMDPQRLINWSKSKLQWLANANQWDVPTGSVIDIGAFTEAANRPDGVIEWDPQGAGGAKPTKIDQSASIALNSALMADAMNDIKEIGGSPEEMRGQASNATSAVGIRERIDAALRQQGLYLDNEQQALIQVGQMAKSKIMRLVPAETIVRITGPNGKQASAAVNVDDPLRREQLEAEGYKVFGSLKRINYDTAVVVSPQSATVRQARAEEQDVVAKSLGPKQFEAIADIWLASKDIKDGDKMAERLQQLREAEMMAAGLAQQAAAQPPMPAGPPMPEAMPPAPPPEALLPPPAAPPPAGLSLEDALAGMGGAVPGEIPMEALLG